jgi:hypothetical protein
MTKHDWPKLQAAYRAAYDHKATLDYTLRGRSTSNWRACASTKEMRDLDARGAKVKRAYDRCRAWINQFSPWDWSSGVGAHWQCMNASAAMMLSDVAPTIPAEGAAYGYPHKEFTLRAREEN